MMISLRDAGMVGASVLGGALLVIPWWLLVVFTHNEDVGNTWLVAIVPLLALGAVLGWIHRWAYLPIAGGMLIPTAIVLATSDGPLAPYILAVGWPVAIAGVAARLARLLTHAIHPKTT